MSIIYKYKNGTSKTIEDTNDVKFGTATFYNVMSAGVEVWRKAYLWRFASNYSGADTFTISGDQSTSFNYTANVYPRHGKSLTLSSSSSPNYFWTVDGKEYPNVGTGISLGPGQAIPVNALITHRNWSITYNNITSGRNVALVRGAKIVMYSGGSNASTILNYYTARVRVGGTIGINDNWNGSTFYVKAGQSVSIQLVPKYNDVALLNDTNVVANGGDSYYIVNTSSASSSNIAIFNGFYACREMTIGLINNGVSNSTKTITYPCAYTTKTAVTSASSKKVYPLYNATNMKIDVSVSETLTSGLPYGVTLAGGYKQDIDTQTVSRASYTSWRYTIIGTVYFYTSQGDQSITFNDIPAEDAKTYSAFYTWYCSASHMFSSSKSGSNTSSNSYYYTTDSAVYCKYTYTTNDNYYYRYIISSNVRPTNCTAKNLGYIYFYATGGTSVLHSLPYQRSRETIWVYGRTNDAGWVNWTAYFTNDCVYATAVIKYYNKKGMSDDGKSKCTTQKTVSAKSQGTATLTDQSGFDDSYLICYLDHIVLDDGNYTRSSWTVSAKRISGNNSDVALM